MLLAVCVRIDLPIDAPRSLTERTNGRLTSWLTALESEGVAHVSLALSGAALACLEREGFGASLRRIGVLVDARRIELLGTPAHGALLPLLPDAEIRRQLQLNNAANRRWFGDSYRAECLWPTELAASHKVAAVATELGFSCMLVDEAALRVWPGPWPANRIDALTGLPGFFAIPSNRAASARLAAGRVTDRHELEAFVPPPTTALQERYLVAALELSETQSPSVLPDGLLARARSVTMQELLKKVSLAGTTSLLPTSRRSTMEEVSQGLPFADWFAPDNRRQALQWRLILRSLDLQERLESQGLRSVPAVVRFRAAIDQAERESSWRTATAGPHELLASLEALGQLGGEQTIELRALCGAISGEPPPAAVTLSQPSL